MNDEVRALVNARLLEKRMSRADLARATGIHPNAVTRALNNTGGRGGNIPPVWAAILEALELELTARPKGATLRTGEELEALLEELPQGGGELERELGRAVLEALGKHAQAVTAPPEGEEGQRWGGK